jgi:predicted transposase/invertase (TIGR01784 family)
MSSYFATVRAEGVQEGIEKGIEKGRMEGIEKGKLEMAHNLLMQGLLSDEQIASVSGLPLPRIQALRNQQQH